MYSRFQLAFKYINYYLNASNGKGHGIHSPFVFDFIKNVLHDGDKDDLEKVELQRQKLVDDQTILTVEDHGAGSSSQSNKRAIASIAKHALKSKKYAQLLYRIVKYYKPKRIVELGTSLGITTVYFSMANPDAEITTLEGAAEIAKTAKNNFSQLGRTNITLIEGNFDYTLPAVLYQVSAIDFAFIDGNHRREPTLSYFNQLLAKTNNNSVIVLDDIHWSEDMEQAWNQIKEHAAVRCTIDLFFIGIVFMRKEFKEKQHFTIRF